MKVTKFDTEQEWLESRRGRITGTRAGNLLSKRDKSPLKGFYELLAERIAVPASSEAAIDRGLRLEDEAIQRFAAETKKKVDTSIVIWERDDNPLIALSPDGVIGKKEAVEVKCLDSANHLKAFIEKKIPSDYEYQKIQYFVVNEDLETLYFVFYDPRLPKDLFWIEVNREEIADQIAEHLAMEQNVLKEIAALESELTF